MKKYVIMKPFFILLLLFFINISIAQEPFSTEKPKDLFHAYISYFKQYDPLAPESVRKAKFNEIINKENPNLSKEDRNRAYTIVDAYIRADKGNDLTEYQLQKSDINFIENLYNDANKLKEKGLQAMYNKVQSIQEMSYEQYKNYITKNGSIPLPEQEIQKAFNQMHQKDGKQVTVTKSNKMDAIKAVDVLQNPKKYDYATFKKALLFIKPNLSEQEIQKAWKQQ